MRPQAPEEGIGRPKKPSIRRLMTRPHAGALGVTVAAGRIPVTRSADTVHSDSEDQPKLDAGEAVRDLGISYFPSSKAPHRGPGKAMFKTEW
ncbi:unnamed protein product [Gongylonema pulchrum]|uniref:Uncharacterized protein n=1 Tax=Gongylonema pulchrum TaxID=637853 RepID=A0A183E810_9BILA|nr:unnamed protein product [Gongylonema pulchrum]